MGASDNPRSYQPPRLVKLGFWVHFVIFVCGLAALICFHKFLELQWETASNIIIFWLGVLVSHMLLSHLKQEVGWRVFWANLVLLIVINAFFFGAYASSDSNQPPIFLLFLFPSIAGVTAHLTLLIRGYNIRRAFTVHLTCFLVCSGIFLALWLYVEPLHSKYPWPAATTYAWSLFIGPHYIISRDAIKKFPSKKSRIVFEITWWFYVFTNIFIYITYQSFPSPFPWHHTVFIFTTMFVLIYSTFYFQTLRTPILFVTHMWICVCTLLFLYVITLRNYMAQLAFLITLCCWGIALALHLVLTLVIGERSREPYVTSPPTDLRITLETDTGATSHFQVRTSEFIGYITTGSSEKEQAAQTHTLASGPTNV